jgi:hypothetical protein
MFLLEKSVPDPVKPMHSLVGVIVQVREKRTKIIIICFRDWMSPEELNDLAIVRTSVLSKPWILLIILFIYYFKEFA